MARYELPDKPFDPIAQFQNAMRSGPPWDSIVDFATHKSYCGMRFYPRQLTLLKLIYLEVESMTQYDFDTIEMWRQGFKDRTQPMGVQPDIWDRIKYLRDNGYHHFPHVQAVAGRRASKGIIGGITGAERLAYYFSFDDWQKRFGIVDNAVGELTVIATTQAQAVDRQFGDIRRTVERCEYLKPHIVNNRSTDFYIRTPADERYIESMKASGTALDREFASLRAQAIATSSVTKRGGNAIANYYDEFAHQIMGTGSTKSGDQVYGAMQPSLSQFGIQKFTYIPSSPFSKIGRFYQLYQEGCVTMDVYNEREGKFERRTFTDKHLGMDESEVEEQLEIAIADPEMLIFQLPSWETYVDWDKGDIPMRPNRTRKIKALPRPVQWSPEGDRPENKSMALQRLKNPETFKVEYAAQFASVENAYLNEVMVDKIFDPPWWYEGEHLTMKDRGLFSIIYRGHADPSRTNANFGFAIGHVEDAPCTGCGWNPNAIDSNVPASRKYAHKCPEDGVVLPHVIIDKLHVWKPEDYENHTINYVTTIAPELSAFLRNFPSMRVMSYDHYAAAFGLIDQQKIDFPNIRIATKNFTAAENQKRFERFKAAVNLELVHAPRDTFFDDGMCLLENELKFLQEKNGKVDKQEIGPVTTKDLTDAVMEVTVELLEEHLERWYKGRNRAAFGSTNTAALRSGRDQQRMEMLGVGGREAPQDRQAIRSAQNRKNLEQYQQNVAARRERGLGARGGGGSIADASRNRKRDYTPSRTRGGR